MFIIEILIVQHMIVALQILLNTKVISVKLKAGHHWNKYDIFLQSLFSDYFKSISDVL